MKQHNTITISLCSDGRMLASISTEKGDEHKETYLINKNWWRVASLIDKIMKVFHNNVKKIN